MAREFDSAAWVGDRGEVDFNKLLKGTTVKNRSRDAWNWFVSKMQDAGRAASQSFSMPTEIAGYGKTGDLPKKQASIIADGGRHRNSVKIGDMFFYVYDPKHKKTLPYYDNFPLVFPLEFYKDGFLGINLHYLPPRDRAILLGQLLSFTNNKKYDETTRLKISYKALKNAGTIHKPCIKRYLYNHVRTKFIRINANEWDNAIFLPVEAFQKASKQKVWRDSKRINR